MEFRIKTLCERDGISEHDAEKRIKQSDQARQAFHRHYFKTEPDYPHLYDFGCNAARIGVQTAAAMVAVAARAQAARQG